jgi:hypothetical protein
MHVLENLLTANIAAMRQLVADTEKALWEHQVRERAAEAERICEPHGLWGGQGHRSLAKMVERRSPGGTKHEPGVDAVAAMMVWCVENRGDRYDMAKLEELVGFEQSFEHIIGVEFPEYFGRYFGTHHADIVGLCRERIAPFIERRRQAAAD